jgi:hypothetical protein
LKADYKERTALLMEHYEYDHSGFIEQLINSAYEPQMANFFSSLFNISKIVKDDISYAELVIHSCSFYGRENLS